MKPTALLVHGRNQDPEFMLALAERFALPGMAYVALSAPDRTWYPKGFMAPLEENEPALGLALEHLEREVRALEARATPRSAIALVGFSQGACLLCEYLVRRGERFGALIAFTGGLVGPPGHTWPVTPLAGTPVLLATSDVDEWVPLTRVVETADVFARDGAEVDLQVYPGLGHIVSDTEIEHARPLLERLTQPTR